MMGSGINEKIGCKFKNISEQGLNFGVVSIQTVAIRDENTNYIFTDEFINFYDKDRSLLEATNKFNTINIAPVTYASKIDLTEGSMYLSNKLYNLKGNFQNVISGEANSQIIGSEENNIIVVNGLDNEINPVSGHNIVSTSYKPNSTTKITSGAKSDMFVIKRAPGAITIIEEFKAKSFEPTPKSKQLYADIINLGAFDEYNSCKDLTIDKANGCRIIRLPENQTVVIKDTVSLFQYNFRFSREYNIVNQFDEPTVNNNITNNLLFGHYINQDLSDNYTEKQLMGSSDSLYEVFDM